MLVKSILNKFKKEGVIFELEERFKDREYANRKYSAIVNEKEVSFITNPCTLDELPKMHVSAIHIRSIHDHSDIMTDYFAGYFVYSIRHALFACGFENYKFKGRKAS